MKKQKNQMTMMMRQAMAEEEGTRMFLSAPI